MNDIEAQQILLALIEQAEQNHSLTFKYINTWLEAREYSQNYKAIKVVIKVLKTAANSLFKGYCNAVITGISDFNELVAYSQLLDIIAFYERDLQTLRNMLDDYDRYLSEGNFWHSFFGGTRKYYYRADEYIWNIP